MDLSPQQVPQQSQAAMKFPAKYKMLFENYVIAKRDGRAEHYDIKQVSDEPVYHILIKPEYGIYRDQFHVLELKPGDFPLKPPRLIFLTKMYHTNVSANGGRICLDILNEDSKWVPTYDFSSIIRNILLLLEEPNNSSPMNSEAAARHAAALKAYKSTVGLKKLTSKEADQVRDDCFAEFKTIADDFARGSKLDEYVKTFPVISGKSGEDELPELEEQLAKMKKKTVVDSATTKPAANRWAKYQK